MEQNIYYGEAFCYIEIKVQATKSSLIMATNRHLAITRTFVDYLIFVKTQKNLVN